MAKSSVAKKNELKPVASTVAAVSPDHDEWEVKDNLSTLMKAHKVSKDPEMMGKIHKHVKSQKQAMGKIQEMFPEESDDKINSMEDFGKRRKKNEINPVGDE